MDFMVARTRFLRYPNLAGNSDFRVWESGNGLNQGAVWWFAHSKAKNRRFLHKIDEICQNLSTVFNHLIDYK